MVLQIVQHAIILEHWGLLGTERFCQPREWAFEYNHCAGQPDARLEAGQAACFNPSKVPVVAVTLTWAT